MTVTIFGATGIVGRELITHAMAKKWKVKAFGRNIDSLIDKDLHTDDNFQAIKGHVFDVDEIKYALTGTDVVLATLGTGISGTDKSRSLGIKNIISQMKLLGIKRIVVQGVRGVLPDEIGEYLMDSPEYPPEMVPVSLEHRQAYLYLKESNLDWTFVCPPAILPGPADNNFITLPEMPTDGVEVSSGNLALFMVEEAVTNEYLQQRVGISNFQA